MESTRAAGPSVSNDLAQHLHGVQADLGVCRGREAEERLLQRLVAEDGLAYPTRRINGLN